MGWAVWLLIPVGLTVLAALIAWARARPERVPGTGESMRAHGDYLDALAQTARAKDRGPRPPSAAG